MTNRITLFLLMLLALAVTSSATPTTHIWGPSTDVQPFLKCHITSDVYLATETFEDGSLAVPVTNLGLTVGVLPLEKLGLEVGFDHKAGLGILDRNPMYFNLKLGIPEDALMSGTPALALGGYDLGAKADATDFNVWYARAAKSVKLLKFRSSKNIR